MPTNITLCVSSRRRDLAELVAVNGRIISARKPHQTSDYPDDNSADFLVSKGPTIAWCPRWRNMSKNVCFEWKSSVLTDSRAVPLGTKSSCLWIKENVNLVQTHGGDHDRKSVEAVITFVYQNQFEIFSTRSSSTLIYEFLIQPTQYVDRWFRAWPQMPCFQQ